MTSHAPLHGAHRLRQLLENRDHMVVCPGVFDGLTGRLALEAGAEALYMTGAGTSLSRLGVADLGLATLNDMVANATMLVSLSPSTPVIADADTGYGGPIMVSRTVCQYARAGVAALHIEDQVQEKRCGHLQGKELVSRDIYISRLRAAIQARDGCQSEMMIIARTDARQSLGLQEAMQRLKEAVAIGVDAVFCEAMQSIDECKTVCQEFKNMPTLLNMVPGGVTPAFTVEEANRMGFRIMIFPGLALGPIIKSFRDELSYLKHHGNPRSGNDSGSIREAFDLCGLQDCVEIDRLAGGKALAEVSEKHTK